MKISILPALFLLSSLAEHAFAITDPKANLKALLSRTTQDVFARLDKEEAALAKHGLTASCTSKNIAVRKEFGDLLPQERKEYPDAVLCLQNKTAITPLSLVPGVRTRYDDFVAVHQNQTLLIHFSGTFLAWHRFYIWHYEQALRIECGYKGYQPYWDWSRWVEAPQDSPIFDGSPYSMGGNGEYINHTGLALVAPAGSGNPTIYLKPGLGGGCVQTGPFANMKVNLGPIGLTDTAPGPDGGIGYNPRCLKRDVGPYPALTYCNYTRINQLMTIRKTIADFQNDLEGFLGTGDLGPHGGGHFTIGGDPGGDLFTSPGDPAFFLHHGQVDRLWTLWQAQDPANRQYALSGTNTMLNIPPSANTTLDYGINLGYAAGPPVVVGDLMSTTAGPFCYVYDQAPIKQREQCMGC